MDLGEPRNDPGYYKRGEVEQLRKEHAERRRREADRVQKSREVRAQKSRAQEKLRRKRPRSTFKSVRPTARRRRVQSCHAQ